jgi:hypothetical protein
MKLIQRYEKILVAAALCLLLLSGHPYAASDKDREVTVVIPAGVVQEFINEVLPVELTDHDKVSGVLRIRSIEDLKLGLDRVWFTATLHGEDMAYKGTIGGLPADVRFDALDSTLHCEAAIRYDAEKRLLYLRPKVAEQGEKGNALWMLLVSLLSGKEYPIEVRKLKPIAASVSDKRLDIDMDIANISTANDRLFIAMRPTVKAKQMDTAK